MALIYIKKKVKKKFQFFSILDNIVVGEFEILSNEDDGCNFEIKDKKHLLTFISLADDLVSGELR